MQNKDKLETILKTQIIRIKDNRNMGMMGNLEDKVLKKH